MHLTKPKESVDILLLKIRLIGPFIVHQWFLLFIISKYEMNRRWVYNVEFRQSKFL